MRGLRVVGGWCLALIVVLLNSVGFAAHAAAVSPMSAGMEGMGHGTETTVSCATQCRTAVLGKDMQLEQQREDLDQDEPVTPSGLRVLAVSTDDKSVRTALYADTLQPPPKQSVHVWHQVFRI